MSQPHPILKKLRFQDQNPVLIVNIPDEYRPVLEYLDAEIHTAPKTRYAFIHIFVRNISDVNALIPGAIAALRDDGYLWISYPKKSSKKYTGDISRDAGWEILGAHDFEPVSQISIDEDWSALRFRPVKDIKTLRRKSAISRAGAQRIQDNE